MSKWGDLAKARFLQKAPGGTPINPENPILGFLGVGSGGFCENQGGFLGFLGFMGVGIGGNPEKHGFSDVPANDPQPPAKTGAELDPDRHCYPHTEACNTTELDLMATRLERFARIGLPVDDAEKLADKLLIRDRDHDDRRACLECQHCQGGRCGNWAAAGFITARHNELGTLATALQRCQGFCAGAGSLAPSMAFAHRPGALSGTTAKQPAQYHPLGANDKQAAQEYHTHHFACSQCQAAGRGYSSRCDTGAALWNKYQEGTTS